jgi:hypothetical protein
MARIAVYHPLVPRVHEDMLVCEHQDLQCWAAGGGYGPVLGAVM